MILVLLHFGMLVSFPVTFGCLHEVDPMLDGQEAELTPILKGLFDELMKIDPETAEDKFNRFVHNFRFGVDPLHANNGTIQTFFEFLFENKWIDKKKFKEENGSIGGMSCTQKEMVICQFKEKVLLAVAEGKKEILLEFANIFSEIQFLSKAPKKIQQDPNFRIQMWGAVFLLRKWFKENFSEEELKKIFNIYVHGILFHFPLDFEKDALSAFSTSRSENEFRILNKQNTNHTPTNIISSTLDGTRNKWSNKILTSKPRGKKQNVFDIWIRNHVWVKKIIKLDEEGQALLKNIERFEYIEGKHYFKKDDLLIIVQIPTKSDRI